MKKIISLFILSAVISLTATAQTVLSDNLPAKIYSGKQGKFHVQGVTTDTKNGFVYFSFTDRLVKTDLTGKTLASVTGIVGHLGDMVYDRENDRIYASLEYKSDVIGKGIAKSLGVETTDRAGFYVAVFECSQITRENMSAESSGVMKTVYLKEVVDDFLAEVKEEDRTLEHRYACSGIDGITLAPAMGKPESKKNFLYVAYGIYGDTTRNDNDHQVILKYNISNWDKYGKVLHQGDLHQSGPKKPFKKYFLKTGNTNWGIQNLAYDDYTKNFYAAVYKGKKSKYPNYSLFVIDGNKKPVKTEIDIYGKKMKVNMLSLHKAGLYDAKTGIRGWNFPWGSTGLNPLGNGLFYISHNKREEDGQQSSTIYKYKWNGNEETPFILTD